MSNRTRPNPENSTVFMSVGEPSGDLHASRLIQNMSAKGVKFRGLGGPKMAEAGCELDYILTDLAVVGFVEVIPKLREFFRVADRASEIFASQRPEAVLLVDFPGFNWHIAKRAKKAGIPVYYYLPPQLWAWGAWRAKKMRRFVDHILCNLPFEQQWFADRGLSAEYVGHPFFDDLSSEKLDSEFLIQHHNNGDSRLKKTVAVLPGSRTREVENIWPMQLEIIRLLSQQHSGTKFMVACLREEHRMRCQALLSEQDCSLPVEFCVGKTSEVIELADCALMKSGSVSLEMMARGTPAVVLYHVSRTLYTIAKRLTNLTSMTLPNLIAEQTIMPEFLAVGSSRQKAIDSCTKAMERLLSDPAEHSKQKHALRELTQQYGQPGATDRAAEYILRTLHADSTNTAEVSSEAA